MVRGEIVRQLDTTTLPVGQGLAVAIEPHGILRYRRLNWFRFDALFDFGGLRDGLRKALIRMPDDLPLVALSHFDADHISGIPELLRHSRVRRLWMPGHGDELRLALAGDAAARLSAQGFSDSEVIDVTYFTIDPVGYLGTNHPDTQAIVVPPSEELGPPETFEPRGPLQEPSEVEGEPESVLELDVQVSRDNKTISLLGGGTPWFVFQVLLHDNFSPRASESLVPYVAGLRRAIGMSSEEVRRAPQEAAKQILQAAKSRSLVKLRQAVSIATNDTSLVIGVQMPPFRSLGRWQTVSLSPEGASRSPTYPAGRNQIYRFFPHLMDVWPGAPMFLAGKSLQLSSLKVQWSALLTGDIGKSGLARLRNASAIALQVPHHGSRHSYLESFYRDNQFEYGIVSHRVPDRQHPHIELLDGLLSHGIRVLSATQFSGWCVSHGQYEVF